MQNKRNKRLLACFLTALGLSANSLNASAENGQTRENIKFYFNIGKNCNKREEKAQLDELAKDINDFVDGKSGKNVKTITYSDIAKKLKSVLINILNDRKNWNSKLASDLETADCSLENLCNNDYYPGKCWIKKVAEGIADSTIKGGKFTVLRGKIIGAMSRLANKLNQEFDAEDENVIKKELDLENKNKTDTWSLSTCDVNNEEVKNAIQCELYDNGSLVVIGNRPNLELTDYTFNTIQKKESVKNIIIKGDIRRIENYAFAGFENLKRITISNSVIDISFSNGAFNCCDNLDEICVSEHAFFYNYDGINKINNLVNKKGLKFRTVKDLDNNHGAIINTWKTGLTIIEKDEEGNEDFDKECEIKDAVHCSLYSDGYLEIKVESNEVDSNKGKLARINGIFDSIPNEEDRIKTRNNVEKVSIIGNVYSIYESFMLCKNLKEITIPNSVKSIEISAFEDCQSLEKITIPNSVEYIGYRAFWRCKSLKEITIPNSVEEIDESAFEKCINLREITIPNSVKEIKDQTFYECTSLEKITIPNSVEKIGFCVFGDCTNLKEITIPNSVEEIDNSAFNGCTNLKEITIPNSVKKFGKDVFKDCKNLTVKIAKTHPKLNDIVTKLKSEGIKVDVVENV